MPEDECYGHTFVIVVFELIIRWLAFQVYRPGPKLRSWAL